MTVLSRDNLMKEMKFESPRASPAETLRAYSFFYGETLLRRQGLLFIAVQVLLISIYLLGSSASSQNAELQSIVSDTISPFLWASFYFAFARISGFYRRYWRRQQLRISVWEREIETFRAKRGDVVLAVVPPTLVLAFWLTLFSIGHF
ncbi:MAG: hypothetical protein DRH70_06575 [Candidatus Coatesbacteria bacterium]|nr:MAG: hypothetical protein DRH70_06575 [Candidatus Coatesbacteria bacterium]